MWQQCKEPKDCGQWHSAQKQSTILVSYSMGEGDVIYRRVWDQLIGKKTYYRRFLADGEKFEPWETEPA